MLGTLLEIVHTIFDVGTLFAIIFDVAGRVFTSLITIIVWIFTFLYTIVINLITFNYTYQSPINFDTRVLTFLNSIPLFSTLTLIIVVAFYVLMIFKILRVLNSHG